MKLNNSGQNGVYVDVYPSDVEEYDRATVGGVRLEIEGPFLLKSKRDYHKATIWLTRKDATLLCKQIRVAK